jgi:hypothetical protein
MIDRDAAPRTEAQPPIIPTIRKEIPPTTRLLRGWRLMAMHNVAERQRRCEAITTSLSAEGLQAIVKDLRDFGQGLPLRPKTRKLLEEILAEDMRRKVVQKAVKKYGSLGRSPHRKTDQEP